jgi:mRNA-degrading endonuclease RelE of RelBE toxin-antitoxin system
MASYKVIFKPSVEKDLHSLPKTVATRIFGHIQALKNNAFSRQLLSAGQAPPYNTDFKMRRRSAGLFE